MSVEKNILRAAADEIVMLDDVYQVDSNPQTDENGNHFIEIDLDSGATLRLTLGVSS